MKIDLNPFTRWALLPSAYFSLARRVEQAHVLGPAAFVDAAPQAGGEAKRENALAILPFKGTVVAGASPLEEAWFGVLNPSRFANTLLDLAADETVKAIVVEVDSPGGTIAGTEDVAEAVVLAAQEKPVNVYVTDMMASAAVWAMSGASSITARPTGSTVGSIGTVINHVEYSRMLEQEGVTHTKVASTALKQFATPTEPLSDAGKAELQRLVDDAHRAFVEAVAAGYGVPLETASGWATGQIWTGREAKDLGLVHHLGGFGDVIARTGAQIKTTPRRSVQPKGTHMNAEMLALLGLDETATVQEVSAAIKARETAAQTRAETAHSKAVAETLGLEPDKLDAELPGLKTQAEDGKAYRADLLGKLEQSVIRAQGNDEAGQRAAERAKRLFANASIADLRDEVEAQEIKAEAVVPEGRLSKDKKARQPVRTGSY